jgi:mono/diheme cytochrome c family protein
MTVIQHWLRTLLLVACLAALARAAEPVEFQNEIAPLLVKRCLACHGETKCKGEYQLHTLAALLEPGASGESPVVAGKPASSYLLSLVRELSADERMPKNADRLPDAEIALIERWIAEGAKFGNAAPAAPLVSAARWKHPAAPETYRRPFPLTALAFDPGGKELAIGGLHEITIWSAADGTLIRRLPGMAERTYALAYSKVGAKLVVASGTPAQLGEVKLLSAADGAVIKHFGSFSDSALAVAFSPDETRLAVGGADGIARVFAIESGIEEVRFKDHSDWILSLGWSSDGGRIVTASRDKTCKVFDSKTGELVTTFAEHGESVLSVLYHPDGKHAISAGADGRIRYWLADDPGWENAEKMDKKKRHQVGEIGGFNAPVQRLAAGDGGLFAGSMDKSVRQFELEKRNSVRSFAGHADAVFALDYHPGTKLLASAGIDGRVRIWNTAAKDEKSSIVAEFVAAPGYQFVATAAAAAN